MKTIMKKEEGFTLLELLLVIGVAALLLIGGIATYRLVSEGNKATEATRLLLTIKQEAMVLAQQGGTDYTGIDMATLAAVGAVRSPTQLNPYNGAINITGGATLTVEFQNVSQAGCLRLITAINNPNEVLTVYGQTPPITPAVATSTCTAGLHNMTWVFP